MYLKGVVISVCSIPLIEYWEIVTILVCGDAGVVDSEDIPLNLSRELLQDSSLIRFVSLSLVSVMHVSSA